MSPLRRGTAATKRPAGGRSQALFNICLLFEFTTASKRTSRLSPALYSASSLPHARSASASFDGLTVGLFGHVGNAPTVLRLQIHFDLRLALSPAENASFSFVFASGCCCIVVVRRDAERCIQTLILGAGGYGLSAFAVTSAPP